MKRSVSIIFGGEELRQVKAKARGQTSNDPLRVQVKHQMLKLR
jgi:hypothetical protein